MSLCVRACVRACHCVRLCVCVRACVRACVREPVFGVCVCAWLTCSLRSFPAECGPKCDNRPAAERATVGLTDLLRRSAPYQLETPARVSRLYAAARHCGTRSAASPGADVDTSPGADVEPSPGADVEPSPSADVRPVPAQTCGLSRRRRAASPGADVAVYPNVLPFRTNMYAAWQPLGRHLRGVGRRSCRLPCRPLRSPGRPGTTHRR